MGMRYYVLRDTDEYIRYDGSTIEVYRNSAWRQEPKLLGVFSGDEPIRNITREEFDIISKL